METYLEHANVTVSDLDRAIEFLQAAAPDFKIRKRFSWDGRNWAHVGTDRSYVALVEAISSKRSSLEDSDSDPMDVPGFNHVGMVVGDAAAVAQRLRTAGFRGGFKDGEIIAALHRRSVYFLDGDGNEYEFMQYLSEERAQRNSYIELAPSTDNLVK